MSDTAETKRVGRPSSFSAEIAAYICARLMDGESLRSICLDQNMPDRATVHRWLASNEAFRDQYARAREIQADTIVDETLDIADDATNDWMERRNDDGQSIGWQVNGEHIQRSRLRIDQRKWMAGKLAPKKYGERVIHAGDAENPVSFVAVVPPKAETPTAWLNSVSSGNRSPDHKPT